MHYTGIDYHKRYSVACTFDVQGNLLKQARIDRNDPAAFAAYFAALDGPSEAVIEACWNWATLYDLLEDTKGVAKVVLSNPAKNRIIADAQIKNDRVDAKALATLLRGNFVATVHVPGKAVRQKKNAVRQRLWLARLRTMVRNRIHTVLDRHPRVERPVFKDPFCNQGKAWMKRVELPEPDRQLLTEDLEFHELLERHIRVAETRIETDNADNPYLLPRLEGRNLLAVDFAFLGQPRIARAEYAGSCSGRVWERSQPIAGALRVNGEGALGRRCPSAARGAGSPPPRSPWPSILSPSRWPGFFSRQTLADNRPRNYCRAIFPTGEGASISGRRVCSLELNGNCRVVRSATS